MSKQRQTAIMEDAELGRGKRAVLVQEQEFRVLGPEEIIELSQIPSEYLLAELVRRKELTPNGKRGYYYHVGRAVDDLDGCDKVLKILEKTALEYALDVTGTITEAAKMLGMPRATYYDKTCYRYKNNELPWRGKVCRGEPKKLIGETS